MDACPECGETNYFEQNRISKFDCGFECNLLDARLARCTRPRSGTASATSTIKPTADPDSRYRLALFDAAQAVESIGTDLTAAEQADFAQRCRELANQMRDLASQSGIGDTKGTKHDSRHRPKLIAMFRRWRTP